MRPMQARPRIPNYKKSMKVIVKGMINLTPKLLSPGQVEKKMHSTNNSPLQICCFKTLLCSPC